MNDHSGRDQGFKNEVNRGVINIQATLAAKKKLSSARFEATGHDQTVPPRIRGCGYRDSCLAMAAN